jgi:DNA-binding XRE family transcriptional regulator
VRELRRAADLTQEELAEKADVSKDLVAKLEQGVRRNAKGSSLRSLAGALGFSVHELLGIPHAATAAPTMQARWDHEFGAFIRQLLAERGMTPAQLEAVLSNGMPSGWLGVRATLPELVAFHAAEITALRAEVAALAGPEGERP